MPDATFGPLTVTVPDGVAVETSVDRLVLRATRPLSGLASGLFAQPEVFVAFPPAALAGPDQGGDGDRTGLTVELAGFSFTQFALPVRGSTDRPFNVNPAPHLHSPPAVLPLLAWVPEPDRRSPPEVRLLAPLDAWHDQVIAVVQDGDGVRELRWGWHGDLDEVPEGFTTTLGLYTGPSPTALLERWAAELRQARPGRAAPERELHPALTRLSYWTDNGAAYWYRTEPGLDLPATLAAKVDELAGLGLDPVPVELDSWFYSHEISRPVTPLAPDGSGGAEPVPPTGMLVWDARPDVLPDGVEHLAETLGRPPLILHSRHISPLSPYTDDGSWWAELAALPADPDFFRRWFDDARRWGAVCVEQDWMVMTWFGIRALRAVPGRARAWQQGLDRAASATGIDLLWCMATPADLIATIELDAVTAVRTCDDYRYADDPAFLWRWYLVNNLLARSLGLAVFKDCFLSSPPRPGGGRFDGDPHHEVEALLSALSGGMAGIGDRIGRTDRAILARLCRPDGLLIRPDRALAVTDETLLDDPATGAPELWWAATGSGPWRYLVALHTGAGAGPARGRYDLGTEMLVYDWRSATAAPRHTVEVELGRRDWALFVCCPLTADPDGRRRALIGDPTAYATMGRSRVTVDPDAGLDSARACPAPGEGPVPLRWWIEGEGLVDR